MKLSVIIPIFNRSEPFARSLQTIATQSMSKADFEVILIDNASTEDLSKVYKPYVGEMNIRHIKYDHKLHPIWKDLNVNNEGPEVWPHTPALANNIGIWASQGEICCATQPDILHSPFSFEVGDERAREAKQIFAEIIKAGQGFNEWLKTHNTKEISFDVLLDQADINPEYRFSHIPEQGHYEMYWFAEFFPKAYAVGINGVDLAYQAGVFAEDDQFKVRMQMAGCEPRWGGRPSCNGPSERTIIGIHQAHEQIEKTKYRNQNRDGAQWNQWADRNRTLWRMFQEHPYMVANTGLDYSPWGEFTIIEDTYYGINHESTIF